MENRNSKEIVFSPDEFDQVTKHLMGSQIRPYPNILVPQSAGPARIQAKEELMMQNVMESCPFSALSALAWASANGKLVISGTTVSVSCTSLTCLQLKSPVLIDSKSVIFNMFL